MHGNILEWCNDWYGDYDTEVSDDPIGVKAGSLRVSRGGSWGNGPSNCRSARRGAFIPSQRNNVFGFRIAMNMGRVENCI